MTIPKGPSTSLPTDENKPSGRCQTCQWTAGDWLGHARLEVRHRLGVMRLALERIAREDYRGPMPESVRIAQEAISKAEKADRCACGEFDCEACIENADVPMSDTNGHPFDDSGHCFHCTYGRCCPLCSQAPVEAS